MGLESVQVLPAHVLEVKVEKSVKLDSLGAVKIRTFSKSKKVYVALDLDQLP